MIYIDKTKTILVCDRCGEQEKTDQPNGVVPKEWMTGHLWMDISLSTQKQIPLCFCSTCTLQIKERNSVDIKEVTW